MDKPSLRILPIGGLGEVGMNCLVLEYGPDMVLIDCGLQFPDASYPGVEVLVPDLNYVFERLDKLKGVIVTHGHDDHIGAIPFLAREGRLDVYATPFPTGLIRQRLSEFSDACEVEFHEIKPREKFSVGCFTFDAIPVAHSIIEALAFAIETPVGTIIHSGDFKHDPNEAGGKLTFEPFAEYGEKGVLLLMSDSTNAEREGHTLSEQDIEKSFERILTQQNSRMIIALFASNIRRLERIMRIAHGLGKKIAFCGRSMHSYTHLAFGQDSLHIPENTVIPIETIDDYPDKDIVILSTGSQAEPRSALVRIAEGIHRDVEIRPGDLVVMSSRFIPGNERAITRMIDNLYRSGAEVMYESIHQIHVSGHGFQDELLMMLNATRPKYFVPIHGEYRHLAKHSKLAQKAGVRPENVKVIEDGQVLQINAQEIWLGEKIPIQKAPAVENRYVDGSPAALSERIGLSRAGIVFAAVMQNPRKRRLVSDPVVSFHGVLLHHDEDVEDIRIRAQHRLEEVYEDNFDHPELQEIIRVEMRRFFRKHASFKPIVIPMVLDIGV